MRKLWLILLMVLMCSAVVAAPAGAHHIAPKGSYDSTQDDGVPGLTQAPEIGSLTTTAAAKPVVGSYSRVYNYGALNHRTGPGSSYSVMRAIRKGEIVKVLSGPHNTYWYGVEYRGQKGYSHVSGLAHTGLAGKSIAAGYSRVIVISLARQQMEVYQGGAPWLVSAVTTGRPELATPTGTFKVMAKLSPYKFVSPWPPGSPYYYEPSWSDYAIRFTSRGHYIHDAPWRPYNGYGTNYNHQDPDGAWRTGSHGCVNAPLWAEAKLFSWVRVGDVIRIVSY